MKLRYLGDSYDLVKRDLLTWLKPLGTWRVHPMFTEPFCAEKITCYKKLLGVRRLITDKVLPPRPQRRAYIELAQKHKHGNVLFDPNTGLKIEGTGADARSFLCIDELLASAHARPKALTAVFDQSLGHGKAEKELKAKVNALRRAGVGCFAYYSHACFIFVSASPKRLKLARKLLLKAGIPEWRLFRGDG